MIYSIIIWFLISCEVLVFLFKYENTVQNFPLRVTCVFSPWTPWFNRLHSCSGHLTNCSTLPGRNDRPHRAELYCSDIVDMGSIYAVLWAACGRSTGTCWLISIFELRALSPRTSSGVCVVG